MTRIGPFKLYTWDEVLTGDVEPKPDADAWTLIMSDEYVDSFVRRYQQRHETDDASTGSEVDHA